MIYILFTLALSTSTFASEELSSVSKKNLCSIIGFAQKNKSDINKNDLFHCHIITDQSGPDVTNNLSAITENYKAMLCHAHEHDDKRSFSQSIDNVNIFLKMQSDEPYYLGEMKTAYGKDIKKHIPELVQGFPKLVNQLNFYKLHDDQCRGFNKTRILNCEGQSYCVGSAEDYKEVLPSDSSSVDKKDNKSIPAVQ